MLYCLQAYGIDHLVIPTRDYLFAPSFVDIRRAVDFIHSKYVSFVASVLWLFCINFGLLLLQGIHVLVKLLMFIVKLGVEEAQPLFFAIW